MIIRRTFEREYLLPRPDRVQEQGDCTLRVSVIADALEDHAGIERRVIDDIQILFVILFQIFIPCQVASDDHRVHFVLGIESERVRPFVVGASGIGLVVHMDV